MTCFLLHTLQGFCNCLTYLYILWICQGKSAQTKSLAGATLCLIGNAGTLLTYGLGVVLDWRQLAGALACLAMPYILGLIFVVPNENDMHTTDIVLDGRTIKKCKRTYLIANCLSKTFLRMIF